MQFIEKKLQLNIPEKYKNSLFFDIETTGLKIETTHLYLFGCIYYRDNNWCFKQWLLESPFEERKALSEINEFISDFDTLITFNGDHFDIPYMDYHVKSKDLDSNFTKIPSLDIYKHIKCCKNLFNLQRAGQKSFESFIGNVRLDEYDGGKLISVYYDYCKKPCDKLLHLLLLHNEEDVLGMTGLISLLPYEKLFFDDEEITKSAPEIVKKTDTELLLLFDTNEFYTYKTTNMINNYYISLYGNKLSLKIPVYTGTLKYFFMHSREYYYLPDEDMAIHKSVGTYVDASHRVQATPETCYAKKDGSFIPLFSPNTKEVYKACMAGNPYALITSELLTDNAFWNDYLKSIFGLIKKRRNN